MSAEELRREYEASMAALVAAADGASPPKKGVVRCLGRRFLESVPDRGGVRAPHRARVRGGAGAVADDLRGLAAMSASGSGKGGALVGAVFWNGQGHDVLSPVT
ncbi:hypothetical protein E1265_34125 [Streptomyces sp. 8K308]|uniref:hypothetical protein n=1 Tax=Streptomyces sp. 8K308 TaxID=2530388 RepID=UPI00104C7393|nr:hypothetical protein [Streptomyces sp. 8K308]TDC07315.1 hypothetical protein E1265_34125 [Streptomyces sp. 8K308]